MAEAHAQSRFEDEQKIMRSREPILGKVEKVIGKDGSENWMTTTKLPLFNHLDEVMGIMGISRDITDLKNAEEDMFAKHSMLQAILDNVPDRIFVKDLAGRYISSNRHHMAFMGAESLDEMMGTTTYDHFPKEVADRMVQEDSKVMKGGEEILNICEKKRVERWRDEVVLDE